MSKTIVNIDEWKGKKHYLWFKEYPVHYYGINKTIDITKFYTFIKANKLSFFIPLVYLANRALNEFTEFRLRKEGDLVILYDIIHPAYTIMTDDGIFDNCSNDYDEDFHKFYEIATKAVNKAKIGLREDVPYNENRYDQYYFTSIPWIDYLSGTHPMPHNDNDYVPRISWGKYTNNNGKITLPFGIQVSHAFVDGYPLAKAFIRIQEILDNVEEYLK